MRAAAHQAARWLAARPFLVCLLWALWLSALYGVFGPHSYVRVYDNADSTLAQYSGMNLFIAGADALSSWAHPWATGVDRGIGGLDTAPFLVLPGWLAYWLVMLGQRLLAAYFAFRLARDRWSLGGGAPWFLAVWYSLFFQSKINDSWGGWTLYDGLAFAAVPAIAWLLLSADLPRQRLLLLAAGAGVLYAWTSNYAFTPFMLVLLLVVLLASAGHRPITWLAFGVFTAAWGVAELPAVLSGVLNAAASHRADRVAFSPLAAPLVDQAFLALTLVRDNVVGIGLGVWAVLRMRDRRALVVLAAAAGVTIAVALAVWGDAALDTYGGPLANLTFLRFYLLLPFLAVCAGAFGVDSFKRARSGTVPVTVMAALALVVVLSLVVNTRVAASMGSRPRKWCKSASR